MEAKPHRSEQKCQADENTIPGPIKLSQNLNDYQVVADIGRGQFGVVQKIRYLVAGDDEYFVWKKICYDSMHENERKQLIQEVQLLQALNHKNVVKYCGKINDTSNGVVYLIMEYCDGGDLGRYLKHTVKKGHYIAEDLALSWYRQLLEGLHYCHTRETGKVLHRDLKPQNILLTDSYKRIKLADFGLAKMLQPTQAMTQTHVGTPYYMSPEMLNQFHYDEKSDVWSLGCLFYEITTGLSPFAHASTYKELCYFVEQGLFQEQAYPSIYDQEILNTIKWMLSYEPEQRPSTADLKNAVLYKWSRALQYQELSDILGNVVEAQQKQLEQYENELNHDKDHIRHLEECLRRLDTDLNFFQECLSFQTESDEAIRVTLRYIKKFLNIDHEC